ncbi:hypothetical protein WOLCODRAFT_158997 [Wolfiporia cocos MD-104 SS10]|uniref:Uncharacterized protein n=1 Tax=Wolfiporia cocos (strain MD-104) TaxID=742152 RepID=A0A2H3JNY2_WOLCO|nr:hypothetical protein WOLCODRAFT_158997 [Wolfiporia cocos MD-104 SS10]
MNNFTEEAHAKLAQVGENIIEVDPEMDLSGQTLVNTSVDEGTLCDDGDKDGEWHPNDVNTSAAEGMRLINWETFMVLPGLSAVFLLRQT